MRSAGWKEKKIERAWSCRCNYWAIPLHAMMNSTHAPKTYPPMVRPTTGSKLGAIPSQQLSLNKTDVVCVVSQAPWPIPLTSGAVPLVGVERRYPIQFIIRRFSPNDRGPSLSLADERRRKRTREKIDDGSSDLVSPPTNRVRPENTPPPPPPLAGR